MTGRSLLGCLALSAVIMACQVSPTPTPVLSLPTPTQEPSPGEICPTYAEREYFASIPSSLDDLGRPVSDIAWVLSRFEWHPTRFSDSWKAEIAPHVAELKQHLADLEQIIAPPPPSLMYLHDKLLRLSERLLYVIAYIDSDLDFFEYPLAFAYLRGGISDMVSSIRDEANAFC